MEEYLEQIMHEELEREGSFYLKVRGERMAQLFYKMMGISKMIITHTEVTGELKGTDAGKALVFHVADFARGKDWRVRPICPFAKIIFKRYPSIQDVFVEK